MAVEQKVFTVLGDPELANGPFVFSCEHASSSTGTYPVTPQEKKILSSHWGWDIGAAAVVDALVRQTDGIGVLANFSRLLMDVNRKPDSDTLILTEVEGLALSFNRSLTEHDHHERLERLHRGFHEGLESAFATRLKRGTAHLVSVHSFTPIWNGARRTMEIGVLFDRYPTRAEKLAESLREQGFTTALNEPYSGLGGELMYSATRHGATQGVPYLELEIRQDLIGNEVDIADVSNRIGRALRVFEPGRD